MNSDDMCRQIASVIDEQILPALQMEGIALDVVGIDRGVVQVRLKGACGSCPSTTYAVLMGIEQELRLRMPEIDYLEAII